MLQFFDFLEKIMNFALIIHNCALEHNMHIVGV